MSDSTDDVTSIFSVQYTVISSIATLSAMYFVYGLYVLLFGAAVYLMRSRQQCDERLNWNLYLSLTVILFVFSTVYVVIETVSLVRDSIICFTAVKTRDYEPLVDYWAHDNYKTASAAFMLLIPIILNITAEAMLIHRCYLIWDSRERVALPLVVASVLTNIIGVVNVILILVDINSESSNLDFYNVGKAVGVVYGTTSVIVNSVLTLLTGMAFASYMLDVFGGSIDKIILESGLLYPAMSMINLITFYTATIDDLPLDFGPLVTLSAGIAPTLIMVRARLGKSVESLQDKVSDIRFTSQPRLQEGTITISRAQVHSTIAIMEVDSG
uniref:G-protein coupled receptors family 1 profile domain-containing protein n=1 Tax=Moniliophthora roreri TaxID=221103 RepID=A0A0W0FIF3_MONRR